MNSHNKQQKSFISLNIAVLTVSDTRTEDTDTSGQTLVEYLTEAKHKLAAKKIVKDDVYQLRAVVSNWIAQEQVQVILITGGTGFTPRDVTPHAIQALLDKTVVGFGELFRYVSYKDIGTSTIQSRAFAGIANRTLVVAMPGSPNACRTAWNEILKQQLDHSHRPCNFVEHLLLSNQEIKENGHLDICEPRS